MNKSQYWADQLARRVIKERKKKKYTCAAGITPSGTVHIGNFREIITAHLVERALKNAGKQVRFIYSWDDYDRFRKVPANVPKKELLQKQIGKPVSEVPDPFGCHKNWAEHFEKELEAALPKLGITPEYIYQTKMNKARKYAEYIKIAMQRRNEIRDILNDYRPRNQLPEDWIPLWVFCEKCGTDFTKITSYDENYTIKYKCKCGFEDEIDFRKKGIVALPWRIDWPARWEYESVDFEAGGKEHSTPGGSYTTSQIITKQIYNNNPPIYQMYDFIIVRGRGGKMSSSEGDVMSIQDTLDIYLPEIVRFLFAGTKPIREFAIPVDEEIIKTYDDFYKCERIYFGKETASERDAAHWSRVYEMSLVNKPTKTIPAQPNFTHLVELVNIFAGDTKKALQRAIKLDKITKTADKERYAAVLACAKNWLAKYAPEKYKFELRNPSKTNLSTTQRTALKLLASALKNKKLTEQGLSKEFYNAQKQASIDARDFFKATYNALVGKDHGPRLAPFILAIGQKKAADLLSKA